MRGSLFLLLVEKMNLLVRLVVMDCSQSYFAVRYKVVRQILTVTSLWVASMLTLIEVLGNGSKDLSLRRMSQLSYL